MLRLHLIGMEIENAFLACTSLPILEPTPVLSAVSGALVKLGKGELVCQTQRETGML
jgi:hypothetical protein